MLVSNIVHRFQNILQEDVLHRRFKREKEYIGSKKDKKNSPAGTLYFIILGRELVMKGTVVLADGSVVRPLPES